MFAFIWDADIIYVHQSPAIRMPDTSFCAGFIILIWRIKMKECFKCKKVKPLDDFYKQKKMSDGHFNKCKSCTREDVIENRNKNIDYYREYDRSRANLPHRVEARKIYSKTEKGIESMRRCSAAWALRNKHKKLANTAVGNAVRDGRLKKQPCEVCGSTENINAHHDDYSVLLGVRWLCIKHHSEHHKIERSKSRGES